MGNFSGINLQDAAFFSDLAYAPISLNAVLWGLTQSGVDLQSAQALSSSHWTDQTQSLLSQFLPNTKLNFFSANGLNEFRVFVNSTTQQIVFAFMGANGATNLLSDLTTTDEGFTQYNAIEAASESLYVAMTKTSSQYSTYHFVADGHSMGGGMAQTFALQNTISGFGQNSLPIAPLSQSTYTFPGGSFSTAATNYASLTNGVKFQNLVLQGDVATALYNTFYKDQGGKYLGTTQWLANPPTLTDSLLQSIFSSTIGTLVAFNSTAAAQAQVILNGVSAHKLQSFIPAALAQLLPGGSGYESGIAPQRDSSDTQNALNSALSPVLNEINSLNLQFNPDGSLNFPAGVFGVAISELLPAGSALATLLGLAGDVGATVTSQPGLDEVTGSATQFSVLKGGAQANVLIAGLGASQMIGGSGNNLFIGGNSVTTAVGGHGINTYEYLNASQASNAPMTIVDTHASDTLFVGSAQITGTQSMDSKYHWTDKTNGTTYQFTPNVAHSDLGTLVISNGPLGVSNGDTITIQNFNLFSAQSSTGDMGIFLGGMLSLNASANAGVDPPAPNFIEGTNQSYTLSVDAPSTVAQTMTVTLTGAPPSDFGVDVGTGINALNGNGTFTVTIPAGETNAAFTLVNSGDVGASATLQLTASLNGTNTPVNSAPLTFNFVETSPDPFQNPTIQTTNVITGSSLSGGSSLWPSSATSYWEYVDDGQNDSIQTADQTASGGIAEKYVGAGSGGSDVIVMTGQQHSEVATGNASYTITDNSTTQNYIEGINETGTNIVTLNNTNHQDVVWLGDGNNQIYGNTQTGIDTAVAQANTGTASGLQGDLLTANLGNNTIVGSSGNDLILVGDGNNLIVAGPGNENIVGGVTTNVQPESSWNVTGSSTTGFDANGVEFICDPYTVPSGVSYEGSRNSLVDPRFGANNDPLGVGNDTIFGGKGSDVIDLSNGANDVELGSGNSTVDGGMGNSTIIGGSGNDSVFGGGGSEYITGGSGNDTLVGRGGNNTIIGGSGSDTIFAGGGGASYGTSETGLNYVEGGTGSDLILGAGGSDTLIGGTGNDSIYGGAGNENIVGGSGNDLLVGGVGNDTISAGGAGADSLYADGGSSSTSILTGGTGQDFILGGSGANILNAGDGGTVGAATSVYASQSDATSTTTIYGGLGVDILQGGIGSSVIYGGDGGTSTAPTIILGDSGNDTFYGGLGTDSIQGGSGTDVMYAGDGGTAAAPTKVIAGSGLDTLYGGAGPSLLQDIASGQDLLVSGTANDSMFGVGNDTLVAGTGNDQMEAYGGSVNFQFNPGFGNDTIYANGGTENLLFGSGVLDTDFTGSVGFDQSGNNYLILTGDGGSIAIEGALTGALTSVVDLDPSTVTLQTLLTESLGGDQTVAGPYGDLTISLGSNETVTAGANHDSISSWGNNAVLGVASGVQYASIYSAGASANITGTSGNASATIISAGNNATIASGGFDQVTVSGANSLVTSASSLDNSVTASGSSDTLVGGTGSSRFYVNNASTVIEASGGGLDTVFASVSYTAPTNVNELYLTGSANIEATGNALADLLTANSGNDTLVAGTGIATLQGGNGANTFVVNNTSDVVVLYTATNNSLLSSVSYVLPIDVNTLVLTGTAALTGTAFSGAYSANDTLISNSGIDTLIGGTGNDTFILNNASDVVQNTAGTATIVYASSANFTLPTSVNTLTLSGTSSLVATGNSGNDSLTANAGNDTLIAGNGNDTLVSGTGGAIDSLVGGTGNDVFVVNNVADGVTVGSTHGADIIQSSVNFTAAANVANLTLIGSAGVTATGNSLANVLTANSGNDTLIAGAGLATLIGGSGGDTFVVNSANDVIQNVSSSASNTLQSSVSNTLIANVNTLVLTGTGNLTGTANSGNDTLISNTGVDTLVGGAGTDTFVIGIAGDVVLDTSTTAANVILSSVNYTLPTDVNALTLTGTAALLASGNSGNDLLTSNSGADTLVAGAGNDTLVSGAAADDSLVGGAGADLFVVNNAGDILSVGGSHGSDTIQASLSFTLPTAVNTLTLTGSGNLTGTALSGNNAITGNAGSDILQAGSGNDTLIAGSGIDTLIGGAGNNTFVINSSADVLLLSTGSNAVISSFSYTMPTNVATLTLTGNANLQATGNAQTDQITANAGNDTLTAGTGSATFYAGAGQDVFVVNSASDQVINNVPGLAYAADTIESSVSYSLSASANNLLLTGSANLAGTGNNDGASFAGDLIMGNAGLDTLTAGVGVDTLTAGAGLATLIGSTGTDTFVINNVADVIQDSVSGFSNLLASSVSYTLPTNVNSILLTGSTNLQATGNSANDSMTGAAGADTLIAGGGNDTLVAGSGLTTLVAGTGNDTFVVNNSADLIQNASAGSQNVALSSATYVLPTNVNQLTLTGVANISGTGNAANDTLTAGWGQDTLVAGSGVDTLMGGGGNDTFVVNSTSDVVQDSLSAFSNAIQSSVTYVLPTNVNALTLTGTVALTGTANAGNDTLVSNTGVDTLVGGAGNDTFVVNNASDIVTDTSNTASNAIQSSVSFVLPTNINALTLTGTAALVGTGNAANDVLIANSGADTLVAGNGADTLVSGSGIDSLVGGTGTDTFVVNNASDVVTDTSTTTSNAMQSSVSYTLPTGFNSLTLTGTASVVATGNSLANVLTANSGNDTLIAGTGLATLIGGSGGDTFVVNSANDVIQNALASVSNTLQSSISNTLIANVNTLVLTGTGNLTGTANGGNDTLTSNSGIDTLVGGSGQDLFIVNNAADVLQNVTSNDTIESSVSYTLPASVANLILIGTASITGTGNSGADTLTAGSGTDTLTAGTGIAMLLGGAGNDTFVVNNASDVVQDSFNTTSNAVQSSVSFSLPQNVDALTLTGTSNLTATGNLDAANVLTANSGNDLLVGTAFSNTLTGGSGSDTIDGGTGTNLIYAGSGTNQIFDGGGIDTMIGGAGSDSFYVNNAADVVQDTFTTTNNMLYSTVNYTLPTNVNTLSLQSGGLFGVGNGGNDLLLATTDSNDTLIAGSGNSTLEGGLNATYVSGSGNDVFNGGSNSGGTFEINQGFGTVNLEGVGQGSSLLFGTGIEPSNVSFGFIVPPSDPYEVALTLNIGSSSLPVGDFYEGSNYSPFENVTFADTGTQSMNQLIAAEGPSSTQTFTTPLGNYIFLTANGLSGTSDFSYAFGNNDSLGGLVDLIAYGNSDVITGTALSESLTVNGIGDVVYGEGSVVVNGSNDTVVAGAAGGQWISIDASTVIQANSGQTNDTINSSFSYNLPTNIQTLVLESNNGLTATSNAYGGNLIADGNSDTLTGGPGQDTLSAKGSNDVLIGGSGVETFFLSDATDTIQFGTNAPSQNTVETNFSYALPTAANSLLLYNWGAVGTGNNANDLLASVSGYDTLVAGAGNDTLVSENGQTTMIGGAGNDVFVLYDGSEVIQDTSTTASNTIQSAVSYTAPVNVNTLILTGSASISATANAGNDTLTSNTGVDTLIGGAGNDLFVVNNTGDVVTDTSTTASNAMQSSVTFVLPTNINVLTLTGTAAVKGTANNGNDTLTSNTGVDTLIGGAGNDLFVVNNTGDVVTDTSTTASNAMQSSVSYVLPTNVKTLTLTGTANLAGTGNSLANVITANSGNDTLTAVGAATTLIGGAGNDLFVVNNTGDVVTDTSTTASNAMQSSVTFALPTNINVLTLTGTAAVKGTANNGNDTLTSNTGVDTLIGGAGNDLFVVNNTGDVVTDTSTTASNAMQSSVTFVLPTNINVLTLTGTAAVKGTANNGNDTLTSNTGVDTLIGGAGNDLFVVNNTGDVVTDTSTTASNAMQSSVSYVLPTNVKTLTLTGTANLAGTGNSLANVITANSGNDTLTAVGAATTLIGGAGNDLFVVNNTGDVVTDTSTTANNTISSNVSYVLPTNVNALTFTGTAALTGTANAGNDTLTSNTGVDTLIGGAGNELFVVNNTGDVVTDTSTTASNAMQSSVTFALPTNINVLTLTGTAAVKGTANNGNDTLTSNTGVDTLIGGAGNELFVVNNTGDVVTDTSTTASNAMQSSVTFALPTNINVLTLTGTAAVKGTANNSNDTLISSNTGVDTLVGGAGSDLFVVNNTGDVVTDTSSTASNAIQSSVSYVLPTNVKTLTLTGTANLAGTGNSLANVITANSGNDTLTAVGAATTLNGGAGNDLFVVNSTGDVVTDTSTTANNTISSNVSYVLPTNVNALTFTGTAALTGTANAGNDTLTSNTGVDTLIGGAGSELFVVNNTGDVVTDTSTTASNAISSNLSYVLPTNVNALTLTGTAALKGTANAGNDTLTSNTGIDTLIGGAGNDLFVVNNTGDVVTDTSTTASNAMQSSVSYTLPTNVNALTLTGTANLAGTGNSLADVLTANSGNDTLSAGSGVATLIGGAGNDTFVINSLSDVIQDTSTTASSTILSSVSYTLPTNVNALTLTGTAALTGTANSGNDTLAANSGADTLVGGAGNDTFVINSLSDVIQDTSTTASNAIRSSVSYTLPTGFNSLTLTGTAALIGTGNAANDLLTANTGADTLVAGNGADTIVSGTGIDSLVGGTGSDIFVVNNASDVVNVATSSGNDTIQSSVNFTLPTNVQYLTLSGTSALTATGNSLTDLIVGNTGNDTLTAGTGLAVLEGGKTSGSDQLNALNNLAALIGGAGRSTLTGGADDFYAAGLVSDSISLGSLFSQNSVVAINKGDGADTVQSTGADNNVLSLGAGIDTENLFFSVTGHSNSYTLVLTDGVTGDSITFPSWYASNNIQSISTLQVIESASPYYNSAGSDPLRNQPIEEFNFTELAQQYAAAGYPANWQLSNDMASDQLTSSATAAYGGDLAYYEGLNGNITGMNLSSIQSTLLNSAFGYQLQTIDPWSSISGGSGLHALVASPGVTTSATSIGSALQVSAPVTSATPSTAAPSIVPPSAPITPTASPSIGTFGTAPEPVVTPGGGLNLLVVNPGTPNIEPIAPPVSSSGAATPAVQPSTDAAAYATPIISSVNATIEPEITGASDGTSSTASAQSSPQATPSLDSPRIITAGNLPELRDGVVPITATPSLDSPRIIAAGHLPELRDGAVPAASTIQIPATSLAMNAAPTPQLSGTLVSAGQASLSPAVTVNADIAISVQSQMFNDGILRAIAPRIASPFRMGVAPATSSIETPAMSSAMSLGSSAQSLGTQESGTTNSVDSPGAALMSDGSLQRAIAPGRFPQLLDYILPTSATSPITSIQPTLARPRIASSNAPVTISDVDTMLSGSETRPSINPQVSINRSQGLPKSLVDPINVAWLTMHGALEDINAAQISGAESNAEHDEIAADALLGAVPLNRIRRTIGGPDLGSPLARQRAV